MENNNYYNKKLKPFARQHRNQSTKAEIRLWCELFRNKQMLGFQFLRQRPIDKYITDFFCKELKLIVETDGISHHVEEAGVKDAMKTKDLEEIGYTVLRFSDNEVMNDIGNVRRTIENWIVENHSDKVHPPVPPQAELPPSKGDTIGTVRPIGNFPGIKVSPRGDNGGENIHNHKSKL